MHVHHIALRTPDVARLAAFYTQVLGFLEAPRPPSAEGSRVWLLAGAARLMIEPRAEGEPGIPAATLELVAFAVPREARARLEARLADAGVAVEARTGFSIYVRDPDGRRVGFSDYAFPDAP